VNIRLTALRQFLAHCSLWGLLPDLPPDRMRAALRRLRIERRRPYQILAEPEWADFLRAARATSAAPERITADREPRAPHANSSEEALERAPDVASEATGADTIPLAGHWWGVPRAERTRPQDADLQHRQRPGHVRAYDGRLQLARSPAGLTGIHTGQRDHALLALALATGLRAIELCSLDLGDLAREWNSGREEWWLVLPDAKTKGQHGGRTLPLASALAATLLEYATATGRHWARAADRATPLFLSRHAAEPKARSAWGQLARGARGRLSPQQVRRIVDRVERQWIAIQQGGQQGPEEANDYVAETRSISPHALRHSTAVALLEGNEHSGRTPASVEHVRGWLGHFDIRTTQGYLAHLDARRHRRPFVLQPVDETSTPRPETQPRHEREDADSAPGSEPSRI
jgi:integrase